MNPKFWLSLAFLLPSAKLQRNTPSEECSSKATPLKRARLNGLKAAISGVPKKSRVKATISSLVRKSANWTIEPKKRDLKISCQIRQGSTWNGQKTEVHFNLLHLCVSLLLRGHFECYSLARINSKRVGKLSLFPCDLTALVRGKHTPTKSHQLHKHLTAKSLHSIFFKKRKLFQHRPLYTELQSTSSIRYTLLPKLWITVTPARSWEKPISKECLSLTMQPLLVPFKSFLLNRAVRSRPVKEMRWLTAITGYTLMGMVRQSWLAVKVRPFGLSIRHV